VHTPILGKDLNHLLPTDGCTVLEDKIINLPPSAVSILRIVSKWMGPISKWLSFFAEARDHGYNILYWTPLQK